MSKPMKTLTLGDVLYEIVDEAARKRVTALEYETTNMSTSINDDIKPSIETIHINISDLNKKIGDVGEYTDLSTKIDDVDNTLDNKINEVDTNLNNKINEKSEELESKINTKITNPETGSVGQILVVDSIDENGKPISYKTIENVKSTYEYAKQGGYTGTEEEFYKKLAQENTSDVEYDELKSDLGGFKFYHNPEVICEVTRTIYSDDTNEYILASSEEGIELLKDTVTYTTASYILLVADNTIYYNSDGVSPAPDTDEGKALLEDASTYYAAEIVLKNEYGEYYKDENDNYILANSETGNNMLSTGYASIQVEGNYYRIAGADSVSPFNRNNEIIIPSYVLLREGINGSDSEISFDVSKYNLFTIERRSIFYASLTIIGYKIKTPTVKVQLYDTPVQGNINTSLSIDISEYAKIVIKATSTSDGARCTLTNVVFN